MTTMRRWIVGAGIAAAVGLAGARQATAAEQKAAAKGACKADAQKLCKDVQPGEGKVLACLKEHKSEVSPACTENLKKVQQAVKQVSAACEPDIEKFCFDTSIGKGGIASCLKQHSDQLSSECKATVAKAKAGAGAKAKESR